ncbi:hypothetical protein LINGRAHAP2_LOCUS3080 [Linum grandiflorum]
MCTFNISTGEQFSRRPPSCPCSCYVVRNTQHQPAVASWIAYHRMRSSQPRDFGWGPILELC